MTEVRYIDAAAILLLRHYDMEEAKFRAHRLAAREMAGPIDVVVLACSMAMESEPWWDSADPKVRAIHQLSINTLLLESLDALVSDVEAALGRELPGADIAEKTGRLSNNVPRILAELKGEEYVDPLQSLLAMLHGAKVPEDEEDTDVDADFEGACRLTDSAVDEE